MLSRNECKIIVQKLARKHNVRYNLIISRLLSAEDKEDMTKGYMSIASLEAAIKAWRHVGMPNYANGETIPLEVELRNEQKV